MTKNIPDFIYGTAWKKEATTALVELALNCGFRAIDTANQAKHYSEILVGDAVRKSGIAREELWLQSKFTSIDGQDHQLPYDPKADIATQVRQSFASTLEHFHTDYLDSYLLHGPYNHPLLGEEDFTVWEVLEELQESGAAKNDWHQQCEFKADGNVGCARKN
jgi:diketogulonate reductase-like aldo/keto reductase